MVDKETGDNEIAAIDNVAASGRNMLLILLWSSMLLTVFRFLRVAVCGQNCHLSFIIIRMICLHGL